MQLNQLKIVNLPDMFLRKTLILAKKFVGTFGCLHQFCRKNYTSFLPIVFHVS